MDARLHAAEPLWREVTGRVIRRHRHDRGERLVETAERAGVSSQYLSEIERGRKDASSELLAAVAGALGLTLLDLTREVSFELSRMTAVPVLRSAHVAVPSVAVPSVAPMNRSRGPIALAA
ncbi:helix-turn-helix domain-containing protein [Gordonia insulae]|uniref:Transcriptional regulator ClgR n=1 Tax=Gordonia insulae TaxID=2420509 RepID=A0A3G8JIY8_9ACTN|nr:helix-turn-helix transcriptional regulator [Gordonia insulae]AZG44994.1 Transcriptional regulator ClgR [Gordonia insulae]